MVALSPASVVVIPFPFSDLSDAKLRPAVVMANAGRGDWLLCQVTSNPYSDPNAIRITNDELQTGTLTSTISFARPIKLFTANESIVDKRVAILKNESFTAILNAAIELLQANMPK
ncbi:MAG: type II toxin-antitoxin system PemK/MazF family toxin [Anaerolineales bacterium]|nr:type II toxin-antitoxin system PemK/MazF family toxin [Acidobacteriota bacterium]WKZ50393.1 MAG: type II toxin-antitoxin system PemK/MazF family toxin [Anaerolineales bacterium]